MTEGTEEESVGFEPGPSRIVVELRNKKMDISG